MTLTLVPPPAADPRRVRDQRPCVRPGCGRRATTTLRFDYGERTMMLDPLGVETEPGEYDLCFHHAARTSPPTGWTLRDRAPSPTPVTETQPPAGPDRGPGVARLAAALSAVPQAVSEDALDAAPDGAGRPVAHAPSPEVNGEPVPRTSGRLDGLLGPSAPGPLAGQHHENALRPVPQPLRLAPDPTTTVWCADLLAPARPGPSHDPAPPATAPSRPTGNHGEPTLFS